MENKQTEVITMIESKFGFANPIIKGDALWFALDKIEGMQVDFINVHLNLRDRKNPTFTRKTLSARGASQDGKQLLYSITIDNHAVQIKVGDEKATLRLNNGDLEWIEKPNVHNVISDYTKARYDKLNAPFFKK
jgi:hypothetical protein